MADERRLEALEAENAELRRELAVIGEVRDYNFRLYVNTKVQLNELKRRVSALLGEHTAPEWSPTYPDATKKA